MTTRLCISLCDNGYQYAALEGEDECFCFNEFEDNAVAQEDSECTAVCAGDENDICGDYKTSNYRRLSVYNGR